MNEIRFDVKNNGFCNIAEPIIDGNSLISILREIELPFAKAEGHPEIAGMYMGLATTEISPPLDYFSGRKKENIDDKVVILDCECGNPGCWEFVVNIEVKRKTVKWKDLEQVYRDDWNYDEIGVLTFDRKQYESALKELAKY